MPEKSVREMNSLERKHYALAAKVFHAILMISLILGLVALVVGLGLYTYALVGQYVGEAFGLSRSTAAVIPQVVDTEGMANEVMRVYRGLSAEEREKTGTPEYRAQFAHVKETEDFQLLFSALREFLAASDVNDIYFAVYDRETSAIVYVCDPDEREGYICEPGDWEALETKELEKFLNWDGTGKLYDIGDTEKYGWLCTAGVPLKNEAGEITGFLLADVTLQNVAQGMKNFALQYLAAMAVITFLLAYLLTQRMKKTLVAPINAIAEAAQDYVKDRRAGVQTTDRFAMLNIRTGDEVENLSLIMADMEHDLSEYEENLTKVTAEKERIGTELALAARIQADILPNIFPPFPNRREFDIFASMNPAKEVGGDFYDFFLIDDDHLGLVIADVSGKGVPAALFMMISKILVQNYAMTGRSPGEVLEAINDQICANNREDMFITIWFGVLELSTGRLTAANAGHEYPVLKHPGSDFTLVKDTHGFVIGGMENMHYREYELQLQPGSRLFVYTDGVPEATDTDGSLFGVDRMLSALRSAQDSTPERILGAVDQAVDKFVGDAQQFDDLTMLCVHYKGQSAEEESDVKELKLKAKLENLDAATEFINEQLQELDCPLKAQMQIDVAIDEIFSNICNYAYSADGGEVTLSFKAQADPRAAIITFYDRGMPYNPLKNEAPDISLSAEDRQIGGLGIFLVRKTMDDVRYQYRDGQNILQIKKHI